MLTCKKCGKEFKIRINTDGKERNLCKRKYCFDCSPFGKHNTKQLDGINTRIKGGKGGYKGHSFRSLIIKEGITYQKCNNCGQERILEDFYETKKGTKTYYMHCKKCHNKVICLGYIKKKKKAIEYLGGKCIDCGYDKHYAALEFDHRDSEKKEFTWRKMKGFCWEKTKKELDKCELRCANCHNIRHSNGFQNSSTTAEDVKD